MIQNLINSEIYQNLQERNQPLFICYQQQLDQIITEENLENILQERMVNWFKQQNLLKQFNLLNWKTPEPFKVMQTFEADLRANIGKKDSEIRVFHLVPGYDQKEDIQQIENNPGFLGWLL